MTNLNNLIINILSRNKTAEQNVIYTQINSNKLFSRLSGPYGIDYTTLRAKGTLQ